MTYLEDQLRKLLEHAYEFANTISGDAFDEAPHDTGYLRPQGPSWLQQEADRIVRPFGPEPIRKDKS